MLNPHNLSKISKKGTNCEIVNLNNQTGRLKVHVNKGSSKKSCTDGGNPTKKIKKN